MTTPESGNRPRAVQRANETARDARIVAAVEIGTTSVRMQIAEIGARGKVNVLESLQQGIAIGRDTFTRGVIGPETTEECVAALKSFRRVLDEYRLQGEGEIKAIATSAVREAGNRDAFLDRLFIATGIPVMAIDEAEVTRLTCLAVLPLLHSKPVFRAADALVAEVGGGSTEALLFRRGQAGTSHTYRLGSLRLRQAIDAYNAPTSRLTSIMRRYVDRDVDQMKHDGVLPRNTVLLALGGEARLVTTICVPEWDRKNIACVKVSDLSRVTNEVIRLSADEVVRKYHVSYPEAETFGPALLIYLRMAQTMNRKEILVGNATLRDGVLIDLATHGAWTRDMRRQIIRSALDLGRRYAFDEKRAKRVARFADELFALLKDEHRLSRRCALILHVAALLQDVGLYISNRGHHKHSMYLIVNSDLFGMGDRDLRQIGLVARYHRKSLPRPSHRQYVTLDREGRTEVAKMAALLRVAGALEHFQSDRGCRITSSLEEGRLVVQVTSAVDLTMERYNLVEKSEMFEQVFGRKIILRTTKRG